MISCQQYDYVEIACMHKFPLILTLQSGENIEGIAHDTKIDKNRKECIVIKSADEEKVIVMDQIAKMEVKIENPHFKVIEFK